MSRKIFISFLGSSNYTACTYVKGEYKSQSVRYIQEATLEYLGANSWHNVDKAYVLVTDGERGSYNKNWLDNGHVKHGTSEVIKQSGLKTQLEELGLLIDVSAVHIKDGNSEKEIWKIFETIYNLLNADDEVYIDITHGFRYLPMLTIVLSNYGKLLKNITVKSITYGNYEARDFEINEAPIIDLTSFSELQDWTNAAGLFVNYGATESLSELINNETLKSDLNSFSSIHNTVRGKELFSGKIANKLSKQITCFDVAIPPFTPIKEKIIDKLSEYEVGNVVKNGLAAVKYCIDFNLTQQGITILSEFVITYLLLIIDEDWTLQNNRNIVSGCLNINNKDKYDFSKLESNLNRLLQDNKITTEEKSRRMESEKSIVEKIFTLPFKKKISDNVYKKLSQGSRNDINHAGIRDEPKTSDYLKDRLSKYYHIITDLIKQNNIS